MKLGIARFVFHYLIYAAARTNHGVYARGVVYLIASASSISLP
jgi:hypothetical protein